MLRMVEDVTGKQAAQEMLERTVTASLANQGIRNIGFPGGNVDDILHANKSGELWCAFRTVDHTAIARRWNAFGVFDPDRRSQIVTVEVNIPTASNSARVAGFFARDSASGAVYLMHDGSIGGGKAGVGRNAFLAFTKTSIVDVCRRDGKIRSGIVIGKVDTKDLPSRLWHFVQIVKKFKDAVSRGDLENPDVRQAIDEWDNYKSPSSGRRRGSRRSDIDYVSYHGEVVERLYEERLPQCADDECVRNNQLIDLYVRKGKSVIEVYEVKTSLDRQSIYTAIGQLITHSVGAVPTVKRVLVIPEGPLASDLERCVKSEAIDLRRFRITSGKAPKVVLS